MTPRVRSRLLALSPLLLATLATGAAAGDNLFGARVGVYTHHSQPYFGAEIVLPLGHSLALNPNFEYVRLGDTQELTYNVDVQCEVALRRGLLAWGGVGLGLLSSHPDGPGEPNTKDGVANLFMGIGLETGVGLPYVTAKYITKKSPQFLLGVGMRF